MMIGLGIDLADVGRFADLWRRRGDAFARRALSDAERERAETSHQPAREAALAWAAKEALGKALGDGVFARPMREVSLERDGGRCRLAVSGATARALAEAGVARIHVDVSGDDRLVAALVVLEGAS
jgi:phosphopantetheine--protein transferase-like protein